MLYDHLSKEKESEGIPHRERDNTAQNLQGEEDEGEALLVHGSRHLEDEVDDGKVVELEPLLVALACVLDVHQTEHAAKSKLSILRGLNYLFRILCPSVRQLKKKALSNFSSSENLISFIVTLFNNLKNNFKLKITKRKKSDI